jgi:outer membrane protein insertion porin family
VGDNEVPINELFIQGGLFSLRGYDHLSVGPKRNIGPETSPFLSQKAREEKVFGREIVIGGHNNVLVNAEIEFPILREARIRGVFFFDAGNAFDGRFKDTSPALLADFGYGFRWFTPIGPLRFEFGYPIVNSGSPKFYFTIGPPF